MSAQVRVLPGSRLHLQHGPIDLVIGADGPREAAFQAAEVRFRTILDELVAELPRLRMPLEAPFQGCVARRMARAVRSHTGFVTPMAAVAGAVADEVLAAMRAANPTRAYVNNGGDIAMLLSSGESFDLAIANHQGRALGRVQVLHGDGIGGIATSGRHGRSLSMGIADSVTVLAANAAKADAAATLIANAVDLPGHPAIQRVPAFDLDPDSDLGHRLVVTGVGDLDAVRAANALDRGLRAAEEMRAHGLIHAAALFLARDARTVGASMPLTRSLEHA